MPTDYQSQLVLYVDDEGPNLLTFGYAFANQFHVLTAASADEALSILRREDVAVLVADQRMPGMTGAELCEQARAIRPDAARMIMTAYMDIHAAIDAINRGQVSRYLVKPWREEDVAEALRQAIDQRDTERAMRDLSLRLLGREGALATLFGRHAHDLLNPLRTLALHVERAETALGAGRTGEAGAELRRARAALDLVLAIGARMREGMLPASEPAACDAASIIETTARIAERVSERAVRVRVAIDGRPRVRMDATSLASVVFNLVSNAAHAIDQAAAGASGTREILVTLATHGPVAVLTIADTGPGIAPDHLAHVFESGFTTRADSTGLGLATVRDLVEAAGGAVSVRSEPGRGAVFEVRLPIDESR